MITQEDIDAMEDGMGLAEQLRECSGGKLAFTNTPNWLRIQAAERIEHLERDLAAEKALSDWIAASYAMSLNDKAKVKACPSLAAYCKSRGL